MNEEHVELRPYLIFGVLVAVAAKEYWIVSSFLG